MTVRKSKPSLFTRFILSVRLFLDKKSKLEIGEDATINPELLNEIHGDSKKRGKK